MIDLRQGDCLQLLREVPDNSIDMVLADPPYGTTRNAWDTVIPMAPLWEQYNRVCKKIVQYSCFRKCRLPRRL